MIKKSVLWLIKLYQKTPSLSHGACKFYPTCSQYAVEAIETYGLVKGGWLSLRRILRCNPWAKPGFDPVPSKKSKDKGDKND